MIVILLFIRFFSPIQCLSRFEGSRAIRGSCLPFIPQVPFNIERPWLLSREIRTRILIGLFSDDPSVIEGPRSKIVSRGNCDRRAASPGKSDFFANYFPEASLVSGILQFSPPPYLSNVFYFPPTAPS